MRYLYTLALYLAVPWVLLRLWRKGAAEPAYRQRWKQRFGYGVPRLHAAPVWIHAVSVGEVRAAEPLVRAILSRQPDAELLLTTTTAGGQQTARSLFGEQVHHAWLPYDLPGALRRFLDSARPGIAIIMETEIWPNLYHALRQRGVALYLVNARLSPASLRGYQRLPRLTRAALACVNAIAAQSQSDARRFAELGAPTERLVVTGNLKLDAGLKADFASRVAAVRQRLGGRDADWVAGSTHEGEEIPLLDAHRRLLQERPRALLIVVPRHPQRAAGIVRLCREASLQACLYSETAIAADDVQVVVVDTLGELEYLYGAAPVAFIGGSLVASGGHNPVEALLAGAAVVTGPHMASFEGIHARLCEAGAVRVAGDASELSGILCRWLRHPEARMDAVRAGGEVVRAAGGATRQTLVLLGYAA